MKHPHWQYFVALGQDLERIGRFVEFETDNFSEFMTFAPKYYRGGSTRMHRHYLLPGVPQPQSHLDAVAQLKAKGMIKG